MDQKARDTRRNCLRARVHAHVLRRRRRCVPPALPFPRADRSSKGRHPPPPTSTVERTNLPPTSIPSHPQSTAGPRFRRGPHQGGWPDGKAARGGVHVRRVERTGWALPGGSRARRLRHPSHRMLVPRPRRPRLHPRRDVRLRRLSRHVFRHALPGHGQRRAAVRPARHRPFPRAILHRNGHALRSLPDLRARLPLVFGHRARGADRSTSARRACASTPRSSPRS